MNAIFISDQKHNIANVYAPAIMARIWEKTGAQPYIYNKAEILADPDAFRDTRFLFSTWGMPVFTQQEIQSVFPKLEAVFYAAGTVQHFARPFLACGVQVHSAWIANAVPVAEYTVAQILLANKGYFGAAQRMSTGDAAGAKSYAAAYPGNFDTRVGIVGTGAIGALVCKMLQPYRLQVVAWSRSLTDEKAQGLGVQRAQSIEEVFATCQVVSNHLANNAHTKGIFREAHFGSMVKNGVFINTGRGAQVVEAEMAKVLAQRPDLTAVLDVTSPEPPVADSPLYTLSNCILTPHIAGSAGVEVQRMAEYMEQEYDAYIQGKPCAYQVTEAMLETMA